MISADTDTLRLKQNTFDIFFATTCQKTSDTKWCRRFFLVIGRDHTTPSGDETDERGSWGETTKRRRGRKKRRLFRRSGLNFQEGASFAENLGHRKRANKCKAFVRKTRRSWVTLRYSVATLLTNPASATNNANRKRYRFENPETTRVFAQRDKN